MTRSTHGQHTTDTRARLLEADAPLPRIDLEHIVVHHPDQPDRWTVVPHACSTDERLTAWLSVDASAVVDLEAWR